MLENRLSVHMHSSHCGQNCSQGVPPVVPGIATENATPNPYKEP